MCKRAMCGWLLAAILAITAAGAMIAGGKQAAADDDDRQANLDRELIDSLSGATLVGSFTVTGRDDADLREERYTIHEVEKVRDNLFLFRVRIQYGERDATVAAPLVVIWSGDTPVITLTDANIPGLGRYTARVLIYRDHYAGYWAAGDRAQGNMFGTIEREDDAD